METNKNLDAILQEVETEVKKSGFPKINHGKIDIMVYGAGDEENEDPKDR